jgi:cytidylate kinase
MTPHPATDPEVHRQRMRKRRALIRLATLFVVLIAIGLIVTFAGIVDLSPKELQNDLRSTGPWAPVLFVLVSGIAGALFVPGPIFAVTGGVLFGAWLGIPLGILGAVLCALICREVAVHIGRGAAEEVAGARLGQLTAWLNRYGVSAVVALRLAPAMPDAPLNYAAGLTRLKRWQIAVGTAIGVIPRTIGWGLVGASAGGSSAWLAAIGGALIIASDAGGVIAAILVARYLGMSPRVLWRKLKGVPPEGPIPTIETMRITIDGPAGAGKSTVARLVADRLEFTYLDTGAMYRCAALASLRGSSAPGDINVSFTPEGAVLLDGEDVSVQIRSPEVTSLASQIAAEPSVRAALVEAQRELMASGDWVAEGRDVGTVVVPNAELKVFLDADPMERAQRRAQQLGADVQEILRQQNERDERDRTRQASPLIAAEDAVHVDTTGLSIEQVVEEIARLALERSGANAAKAASAQAEEAANAAANGTGSAN